MNLYFSASDRNLKVVPWSDGYLIVPIVYCLSSCMKVFPKNSPAVSDEEATPRALIRSGNQRTQIFVYI